LGTIIGAKSARTTSRRHSKEEEDPVITKEALKAIVAQCISLEVDDFDDKSEIVLDSLALIHLRAILNEQYGLVLDPSRSDLEGLTSVISIYAWLRQSFPDRVPIIDGAGEK
jgi:acyl carrier protein